MSVFLKKLYTKVGMFGDNTQHHIWWKPITAYEHKHLNWEIRSAYPNHF